MEKIDLDELERLRNEARAALAIPFYDRPDEPEEEFHSAVWSSLPALIAELREARKEAERIKKLEAERDAAIREERGE